MQIYIVTQPLLFLSYPMLVQFKMRFAGVVFIISVRDQVHIWVIEKKNITRFIRR